MCIWTTDVWCWKLPNVPGALPNYQPAYQWDESNRRFLVLEATTLPTVPQPLAHFLDFPIRKFPDSNLSRLNFPPHQKKIFFYFWTFFVKIGNTKLNKNWTFPLKFKNAISCFFCNFFALHKSRLRLLFKSNHLPIDHNRYYCLRHSNLFLI